MFYFSRAEQAALLFLAVLLLLGAGAFTYAKGQNSVRAGLAEPLFVPAPEEQGKREIMVEVAGAVAKPGIYRLPFEARVHEAVEQAGGLAAEAETNAINFAARLHDGEKIVVPAVPQTKPELAKVGPSVIKPAGPISLNSATAEELEALPGIGPVYAKQIVAYREKKLKLEGHGFQSMEELLNVPGIGPKRFIAIRELVTL